MTNKDYILAAVRTNTNLKNIPPDDILHASMGLVTESGEMMDQLKRHMFYGKPLDIVNLKEELGDIFWYAAILLHYLGIPLEDIMRANIEKLSIRYPEKFTEVAALNRNLEAERKSLENNL